MILRILALGVIWFCGVFSGFAQDEEIPPLPPSNLVASEITADGFTLSWTATNGRVPIIGYELMLGNGVFARIAAPTVTFKIKNLTSDSAYAVRIATMGGLRSSVPSASIEVRTLAATGQSNEKLKVSLSVPVTSWLITQGAAPLTDEKKPFLVRVLGFKEPGNLPVELPRGVLMSADFKVTMENLPPGLSCYWASGDREAKIQGRPQKSGNWKTVFTVEYRGERVSSTIAIEVKPPTFEWNKDPSFALDDCIGGVVLGGNGEPVAFSKIWALFKRREGDSHLLSSSVNLNPAAECLSYSDDLGVIKAYVTAGSDDAKPGETISTNIKLLYDFAAFFTETQLLDMAQTPDEQSRELRAMAIQALLWDDTKPVPDSLQRFIVKEHYDLIAALLSSKRLTKAELEAIVKNPAVFKGAPTVFYNDLQSRAIFALGCGLYASEKPPIPSP